MPGPSSTTFVHRWPTADAVIASLREWAARQAAARPEFVALGYFGSHARSDAGFGSDLDLVAVVERSDFPRLGRGIDWPYEELPVPADLIVYTEEEWRRLLEREDRFTRVMQEEVVWITLPGS